MPFPKRNEIAIAILKELVRAGGQARPADLYDRIASHFDLREEDKRVFYPGDLRTPRWKKDIQWTRYRLAVEGRIDPAHRGIWRITDKGRASLKGEEPPPDGDDNGGPPPPDQPSLTTLAHLQDASVKKALLQRVAQVSPAGFEHLVAAVLVSMGFSDVRVTGRSHDRGVDGECAMPLLDLNAAFQAKRYGASSVGGPLMAEFRGRILGKYDRGIYITTSSFTSGAEEMANQPGGIKIILIDGKRLVDLMIQHGLGVKSAPLALRQVDESFFEQLPAS